MKEAYDDVLVQIAEYVSSASITSDEAYQTARASLADALGCALLALNYPACTKLLGPLVEGTLVPNGSRVPGTDYVLDPVRGAFNIGTMIRWLDYNDTWLAAEWGHPSDNFGGILAVADHFSRQKRAQKKEPFLMQDVLTAAIKAYEIQGNIALLNSFNRIGFDHVILVKVATAAVATHLMGGTSKQIMDAVSNAWIDTGSLRTYRHFPNTGSRKSWAAGDATSRGTLLAWMTMRGEMGYPTALTAESWGFYDVLFEKAPFQFQRPFGSYVMENILYKISFPAEFHGQTAIEAALELHPKVKERLEDIQEIEIETQSSAMRIIDKKGPLKNPADRDHCLQYMIAIGLIYGNLTANYYEDKIAKDPRIDSLRSKMKVFENEAFSRDYLDPDKRSIANSLAIHFKDGSRLGPLVVEYPLGHRKRRQEGMPLLFEKCATNLRTRFDATRTEKLLQLLQDHNRLITTPVDTFMDFTGPFPL